MYNKLYDITVTSSAEKAVLHTIQMLAPMKYEHFMLGLFHEEQLHAGQTDFYLFIEELYLDILRDSKKYYISSDVYDNYMKHDYKTKISEKAHKSDGKESKLRNTFLQAIQFYPKYIFELGISADRISEDGRTLVIARHQFENIPNRIQYTHIKNDIECRRQKFHEFAFEVSSDDDNYYLSSQKYTNMFIGLWLLCKAKESKYKYLNFLRIDYASSMKTAPEIEDIKPTLTANHQQIISDLQAVLSELSLKVKIKPIQNITSGTKWKVEYLHKSKNVFGFYAAPEYLMLCIYFNDSKNITEMGSQLKQIDQELYDWYCSKFPERLCKCPYNRRVTFDEASRRICGLSNRAEILDPSPVDAKNSIRVLKLFRKLD